MKERLLLLILLISHFSFAQKDFSLFYRSGKLQSEMKYDSSCSCKRLTDYYESGEVRSIAKYIQSGLFGSQIDGENTWFFKNGQITLYQFWKNGAPDGRKYCNYENNRLAYENFFSEGFKTGTWKYYNESGTLREERIFINNKTKWDTNNDFATRKFYFNNKLAYTIEVIDGREEKPEIVDKNGYGILTKSTAMAPTGKKIFTQNCSQCHNPYKDAVGPMMKGIVKQRTNDWLGKMIRNGQALVESGDENALKLYKKWGNIKHPNFERLTDEELKKLMDYLKTIK